LAYFHVPVPDAVPSVQLFLFGMQGWIPAIGHTVAVFYASLRGSLLVGQHRTISLRRLPFDVHSGARLRSLSGIIAALAHGSGCALSL
jgi:hypothetical protein